MGQESQALVQAGSLRSWRLRLRESWGRGDVGVTQPSQELHQPRGDPENETVPATRV